jgi:hypothetical protein
MAALRDFDRPHVCSGSFASGGRAARLRGMSAMPAIAPELMRRRVPALSRVQERDLDQHSSSSWFGELTRGEIGHMTMGSDENGASRKQQAECISPRCCC